MAVGSSRYTIHEIDFDVEPFTRRVIEITFIYDLPEPLAAAERARIPDIHQQLTARQPSELTRRLGRRS